MSKYKNTKQMNKKELTDALLECKVAYKKYMDDQIKLSNERKLAILETLLSEFPFITYDYTSSENGSIRFFIGKKEIHLEVWDKPCFWLTLPYKELLRKRYRISGLIFTKVDFGKVLDPMLEKEILGED